MAFTRLLLGTAAGLTVLAPRLAAQPAVAQLLIGAGTATDLRGVRSGAYLLAPSIMLTPTPDVALNLGGRGTRFSTGEWSLGGSATGALRIPLRAGFGLVLNTGGDAIRTSYRATYLAAEGLPSLEWRHGVLGLWGGARAAVARTTIEAPGPAGSLPLPGRDASVQRSLLGPAFGATLRIASLDPAGRLSLSYREEHSSPDRIPVTDRTAGLSLTRGSLALSGSVGIRRSADERRGFGGVRLAVTLLRGITAIGAAESYPSNRLTGTVGGRAFTAGLSLASGGPRRPKAPPKPAGVPAPLPSFTRLAIAAPAAQRVEVAGDWNDWVPVVLEGGRNGVWYVDLSIPAGSYRYAFRIDGKVWDVPEGVAAVDDGFGGKSAWLTVGASRRTAPQSANRKEVP